MDISHFLPRPAGISELLVNHSLNCCSSQLQRLTKTKSVVALSGNMGL